MLNINIDSDLEPLRMSVQEMQELEHTIQDYTTGANTLQQLQQLTIQLQGQAEPNIVPLETEYIQLQQQHDALSLKIGAQTQQLENSQKALAQLQEKLPATAKKQKHNTNKRAAYINYCQVVTPKRFHCSNLYSELCWTIY